MIFKNWAVLQNYGVDFLSWFTCSYWRQFQGKCSEQVLGNSSTIGVSAQPAMVISKSEISITFLVCSGFPPVLPSTLSLLSLHSSGSAIYVDNKVCLNKVDTLSCTSTTYCTVVRQLKCYLSTVNGLFLEKAIKLFSKPPILVNFNYLNTKLQYFVSQIKINLSSDAKLDWSKLMFQK